MHLYIILPHAVRVLAGTILFLAIPGALRSAPPSEFVPDEDVVLGAVEAGLKLVQKEFEITGPMETALLRIALQGKSKGTCILSIILVRGRGDNEVGKQTFHKVFNEQFTMKMVKVSSPAVEKPIAFISLSTAVDRQVNVEDRIFAWDRNLWSEVSEKSKQLPKERD